MSETLIYGIITPALIFGFSFLITYLLYKRFTKEIHKKK